MSSGWGLKAARILVSRVPKRSRQNFSIDWDASGNLKFEARRWDNDSPPPWTAPGVSKSEATGHVNYILANQGRGSDREEYSINPDDPSKTTGKVRVYVGPDENRRSSHSSYECAPPDCRGTIVGLTEEDPMAKRIRFDPLFRPFV